MKISEFIEKVTEIQNKIGDVDIIAYESDGFGWAELDPTIDVRLIKELKIIISLDR
jgi:hypothetical protein